MSSILPKEYKATTKSGHSLSVWFSRTGVDISIRAVVALTSLSACFYRKNKQWHCMANTNTFITNDIMPTLEPLYLEYLNDLMINDDEEEWSSP